jgi:hypothetical protein
MFGVSELELIACLQVHTMIKIIIIFHPILD